MGCSIDDGVIQYPSQAIAIQATRLKYVCQMQSQKLDLQLKKLQTILIEQFQKPLQKRSKKLQLAMIRGNIRFKNQKLIYLHVLNESKKILEYKNAINSHQNFNIIKPSVDLIVYCSVFLGGEDLSRFAGAVRNKYRNYVWPTDREISDQLIIRYKQSKQASFTQQKQYVFELSINYGTTIDQINAAGHNYKYNATSYQQ